MKQTITFLLLIALSNFCFCQKNREVVFMFEGECHKVLNNILNQIENDSIGVNYFLENYKIFNNPINNITDRKYQYIIKTFNLPLNKDIYCIRKTEYYKNTLLIEQDTSE